MLPAQPQTWQEALRALPPQTIADLKKRPPPTTNQAIMNTPAKPFPGSLAEKIPAQAAKNAIPWIVIGIGIVAGIGGMWYYYKNLR